MLPTTVPEAQGNAPGAIQYMPPGEHRIFCTVNGKGAWRTVIVGPDAAERLQADLERRMEAAAAGRAARPCLLFNHQKGASAGVPLGFTWDDAKGVLLRVQWSGAGSEGILRRDYAYFSPSFSYDRETGQVTGLLSDRAEVGSLVNDPAFERIERICAARADGDDVENVLLLPPRGDIEKKAAPPHNEGAVRVGGKQSMKAKLIELLGLPEDADEAAVIAAVEKQLADNSAAKKQTEEVQAECKKKDEQLKAMRAEAAQKRVDALIVQGVFAPQEKERIEAARALAESCPDQFDAMFKGETLSAAGRESLTAARPVGGGKAEPETAHDIISREMANFNL